MLPPPAVKDVGKHTSRLYSISAMDAAQTDLVPSAIPTG